MRFRMLMMGLMVAVLLAGQIWANQHQGQPVVTDAAALPLSKIVLYTSGVGYFERQGQVEGGAGAEHAAANDRNAHILSLSSIGRSRIGGDGPIRVKAGIAIGAHHAFEAPKGSDGPSRVPRHGQGPELGMEGF